MVQTDTIETHGSDNAIVLKSDDLSVHLPSSDYIRDAEFLRDGIDLVLKTDHGQVVVQDYFAAEPAPYLVGPDGASLSPPMIFSFLQPAAGQEYADANGAAMNDVSPIGVISELNGEAHITRTDGTVETIQIGTPVFQGDTVETNAEGAVNITFIDETSFAVSEDARLSIDEYVYDPATSEGTTNFSVLKGMFVFTSGMIGREDPDDVHIQTPQGSIGIRGTIIAGDVDNGEITVVEGAIVLRDFTGHEMTLATQFETARFDTIGGTIHNMGQMAANDVSSKFSPVSTVSGTLFSSINDAAHETNSSDQNQQQDAQPENSSDPASDPQKEGSTENAQESKQAAQNSTPSLDQNASIDQSAKSLSTTTTVATKAAVLATTQAGTETGRAAALVNAKSSALAAAKAAAATTETHLVTNTTETTVTKFSVTTSTIAVEENTTTDTTLARIVAVNATTMTVTLLGASIEYYEVFQISDTVFGVRLKSGYGLDYERDLPAIEYRATNGAGTQSVTGSLTANIIDVNETPVAHHQLSEAGTAAGAGQTWTYNFSSEFKDPDAGDTLTYSIYNITGIQAGLVTAGIIDNASDLSINSTTGVVTITLSEDAPTNDFTFKVVVQDSVGHTAYTEYTFDVYAPDTSDSGYLTGSNETVIVGGTSSFFITGDDNIALFSNDADTINLSGSGNTVIAGGGNDDISIEIGTEGNTVSAGNGNDNFSISSITNTLHGEAGNDKFSLNMSANASLLSEMSTSSSYAIDGGADNFNLQHLTGGDTLFISTDGNNASATLLDFTTINDNFIKNIEVLNIDNGDMNNVKLSYSDVIAMTDGRDTLVINGDNGDTVDFQNSGHAFENTGTATDSNGETFNIFSDGNVTLYIDTDVTVTAGLPA